MANDVGWAFIHAGVSQLPGGEDGSVQINDNDASFNGDSKLKYDLNNNTLSLEGDLDVAGNINANAINIDVTNKNITNLDAFGSTNFGDTADDTHDFKGEMTVDGNVNATSYYGDGTTLSGLITSYTNSADNRLVTSVDGSSVNAEENLMFDGSDLILIGEQTVTDQIRVGTVQVAAQANVNIGGPIDPASVITPSSISTATLNTGHVQSETGRFTVDLYIGTASTHITENSITTTTMSSAQLAGEIQTSAQPLITSLGNLDSLTVDSTTLVVKDTTQRVGIGRGGPVRSLDVLHISEPQVRLSNTNEIYVDLQATTDGYLSITPTAGRVGIMTDSPTEALDVDGNVRITGNLLVEGTLSARVTDFVVSADTTTLGDSQTDSVVINAGTVSASNGLNFEEGTFVIDSANKRIGIGVDAPSTSLEITSATDAHLKLSNAAANTILTTLASGEFSITPTGASTKIDSELDVSGDTTFGTDTSNKTDVNGDLTITGLAYGPEAEFDNLKGTTITDNVLTINGGDITGAGNISASTLAGTLTTAHQTNITKVGNLENLTVDSDTLVVKSTTHRVGIGRGGPARKLDVMDATDPQVRLSNTSTIYTDFQTDDQGNLSILPTGTQVKCGGDLHVEGTLFAEELKVKVTEVERVHLSSSGSTTFGDTADDVHIFNGNVQHQGGIVHNRTVVTGDYTVAPQDYLIAIKAAQNLTITLPAASSLQEGQLFRFKDELGNADDFTITVLPTGGDLIDGDVELDVYNQHEAFGLYTDGVGGFFIL
tara:strand:+ start:378 stop:2696 length:2319 start_codon:yes stop_codon:yes gene_type:complete